MPFLHRYLCNPVLSFIGGYNSTMIITFVLMFGLVAVRKDNEASRSHVEIKSKSGCSPFGNFLNNSQFLKKSQPVTIHTPTQLFYNLNIKG